MRPRSKPPSTSSPSLRGSTPLWRSLRSTRRVRVDLLMRHFAQTRSGVFKPASCPPQLDHMVNVVGWGVDGSQPYWILKSKHIEMFASSCSLFYR